MKRYSPTSPARRHAEFMEWHGVLTEKKPEKSLTFWRSRSVGRNNQGRITTRHKGGGVPRRWREIDFLYDKKDMPARVMSIEYDPNRTAYIALVCYRDGERRYVLAPQNLKVGSEMISSRTASIEIGNRLPLEKIPIGTMVYNVELVSGKGAALVRAAGTGAMVLAHDGAYAHLELPSKEVRMVLSGNWASIGALSRPEHNLMVVGNAGRSRKKGIRPTVRGSAMNPVDHPHGGGEGRTLIGRRRGPATPWGKPARGVKTRKKKKQSNQYIISRRRK